MTEQYWAAACTKNCVWLFQVKRKQYTPNGCTCDIYDEEGELIEGKEEEEKQCQCFVEYWETEKVFLTVREAKEYGRSRPYAWGEENEGWQVYGVCAEGMMVELLGKHNKEFEKDVEYITVPKEEKSEGKSEINMNEKVK